MASLVLKLIHSLRERAVKAMGLSYVWHVS